MADNNFDIAIRFLLEKGGNEQAVDALRKLKAETEKVKPATVDFSKTQAELEKNISRTSTAADDLSIKKKELLKLAHLLPGPIRAIGSALNFAFSSPLVAAVAALLVLIRSLVNTIREAKEKAEALNLARTAIDLKNVGDEAGRVAENWQGWAKAIGTIADDSDTAITKTRELAAAAEEVAESELNLARARVQSDPNLSPEQKSAQLAGIDAAGGAGKSARAQQLRSAEITETEKRLAVAEDFRGRSPLETSANQTARRLEALTKAVADFTARIAKYDELQKTGHLTAAEYAERNQAFDLKSRLAVQIPDATLAAEQSAAALTAFDARRATVPGLRAKLAGLRFTNDLRNQTDQTVSSNTAAAAALVDRSGLPGGRIISDAAEGADVIRAGGQATADQKSAIVYAAKAFGLVGQNSATILAMLSRMNDNQTNFAASLERLKGEVKNNSQRP